MKTRPLTETRAAAASRSRPVLRLPLACLALLACAIVPNASATGAPEQRSFGPIQPRLSPDGQQIAMSWQGAICRMPSTGGALTVLTRGEGFDIEPAWSPDGNTIAFINSAGFFAGQLQWINAEDGTPRKLPAAVRAQGKLHFHPDGKRLLGRFSKEGAPDRLAWFDLKSGALAAVEGLPQNWQTPRMPVALSNDGEWLLYALHQDVPDEQGGNNGPHTDLWKLPTRGGTPQLVTRWLARIYQLAWDAKNPACYVVTDLGASHNDLWHVPLANPQREARKITSGQADEDWPSVETEGRFLVHTENHEGATALVLTDFIHQEKTALSVHELEFEKAYREPTALLRLEVGEREARLAAKVSLKRKDGKFFAPLGSLYRVAGGRMHFYARGGSALLLPAGVYEITAWRGPEHRVLRTEIELEGGKTRSLELKLERWTDAWSRGWFSGENHIHANYGYGAWYNTPASILDMCEGEDLNVCNLVVANSDGDGVFDREFFRGGLDARSTPRTLLYWNQEFRSTIWGHMTFANLGQLVEPIFTGFKDTTNPWDIPTNADLAGRTRAQGGVASYTHPANNPDDPYATAYSGKGIPVDVALERIDTLDVMGFGYAASVPLWYRVLNCGFRVPAAAGTDCFLNRITSSPPGWGRCYVRLTNGLAYPAWIEGQRAGRSFISNGPMLELTVADSAPGDTIKLATSRSVRVRARGWSQAPLEKLELIYNGRVVATGRLSADKLELALDRELPLDRTGWVSARVSGPPAPDFAVGPQQAHANPIYVDLAGSKIDSKADAEYFLAWIDRLEADLNRRNRMHTGKDHIAMQLNAARDVYRRLAGRR
ncbi:MAG TPA: CehA/McbA family metallohydrolase [Verrucomicrobiae bacterium]|nr:CehA/McbA family metallohydrolase [Verrucomicrobiae bacterium]